MCRHVLTTFACGHSKLASHACSDCTTPLTIENCIHYALERNNSPLKCLRDGNFCSMTAFGKYIGSMEAFIDRLEREEYNLSAAFPDIPYEDWLHVSKIRRHRQAHSLDIAARPPSTEREQILFRRAQQAVRAMNQSKMNLQARIRAGNSIDIEPQQESLLPAISINQAQDENLIAIKPPTARATNKRPMILLEVTDDSDPEDPFVTSRPTRTSNLFTAGANPGKRQRVGGKTAPKPVLKTAQSQKVPDARRSGRTHGKVVHYVEESDHSENHSVDNQKSEGETKDVSATNITSPASATASPEIRAGAPPANPASVHNPSEEGEVGVASPVSSESSLSEAIEISTPSDLSFTDVTQRAESDAHQDQTGSPRPCGRGSQDRRGRAAGSRTETPKNVMTVSLEHNLLVHQQRTPSEKRKQASRLSARSMPPKYMMNPSPGMLFTPTEAPRSSVASTHNPDFRNSDQKSPAHMESQRDLGLTLTEADHLAAAELIGTAVPQQVDLAAFMSASTTSQNVHVPQCSVSQTTEQTTYPGMLCFPLQPESDMQSLPAVNDMQSIPALNDMFPSAFSALQANGYLPVVPDPYETSMTGYQEWIQTQLFQQQELARLRNQQQLLGLQPISYVSHAHPHPMPFYGYPSAMDMTNDTTVEAHPLPAVGEDDSFATGHLPPLFPGFEETVEDPSLQGQGSHS